VLQNAIAGRSDRRFAGRFAESRNKIQSGGTEFRFRVAYSFEIADPEVIMTADQRNKADTSSPAPGCQEPSTSKRATTRILRK
jgi:hypothetical protein